MLTRRTFATALAVTPLASSALATPALAQHAGHDPVYSGLRDPNLKAPPPEVVKAQLRIAGYADVGFERIDAPLLVGRDPEEAVALQFDLGPAGEIVREAGELAERQREPMARALTEELGRYRTSEGVMMDSSSWMVTARNPG